MRGVKNAFRNGIRTFSIVIILGLSIGLALTMLMARVAVEQKISSVKSSIGNTISVNPAGAQGFEGGGTLLTTDQVTSLSSVAHVTRVLATLGDRLNSTNTSLQSAVEAGAIGARFGRESASSGSTGSDAPQPPVDAAGTTNNTSTRSFTPPIRVTGVSDLSQTTILGSSTAKFTSGAAFDATKDENVAVIGSGLASKNNLSVGSTFQAYGTDITVVGIYDTGTQFGNNSVIMPLAAVQRLSSQTGVNAVTVTVDSIDNVNNAVTAIKAKLGTAADVTSNQDTAANAVMPLENVKTIAVYSLIAALIAGAVIILLTMVMIVRERRREIGVMKAIGSSNGSTMFQFMVESVTFTVLGLIVGVGIALAASTPITNALVTTSSSSSQSQGGPGGPGGFGRGLRSIAGAAGGNLRTVTTSVSPTILGEGVLAALVIALVGSAVPAYFISRIRPSDVMRAE